VLLPGLDGTGTLFSPLLCALSEMNCEVLSLPKTGSQDYLSIAKNIKSKLPKEDFILVAESFSGPIGATLAKEQIVNLKGIVFVATFLTAPNKLLLAFAKFLPLKLLLKLPFSKFSLKLLFLGSDASNKLVNLFKATISKLPTSLIKARLSSIYSLSHNSQTVDLPTLYIQATLDKLVKPKKIDEFKNNYKNLAIKEVEGPHFILQSRPKQCAEIILAFVRQVAV
jgi:pimeloyl-[acyl-carrier protein] methyl ester esterase